MIKALVVGGPATFVNNVVSAHLAKHGIEVVAHRDYDSRKPISAIPTEAELVLCMHDMINHPTHDSAKDLAKAHGLPFVLISRKYSVMAEQLTKVGYPALNLPDLQDSEPEEPPVKAEVAIPAKDWRLRLVGKAWEAVYAEGQYLHGGFSSSIEAAEWTRRYGAAWLEDQQKSETVPVQKIQANVSAADSFVPVQDALNEVGVRITPYMFKSSFPSVRTDRRKDGVYVDLVGLKAVLKRSKENLPADAIKRVDVEKILGINPDSLAVPIRNGRIPSYKHAGAIWVSKADVMIWKTQMQAASVRALAVSAPPEKPREKPREKPPVGWAPVAELKKKYGVKGPLAYKIAKSIPSQRIEGPWSKTARKEVIYVEESAFLADLQARRGQKVSPTWPSRLAPKPSVPPRIVVAEPRDFGDLRLKALVSELHAVLCAQNFTGDVCIDLDTGKLRGTKTVIIEVEL